MPFSSRSRASCDERGRYRRRLLSAAFFSEDRGTRQQLTSATEGITKGDLFGQKMLPGIFFKRKDLWFEYIDKKPC